MMLVSWPSFTAAKGKIMAQESLTAKILYSIIQIIENAYDKKICLKQRFA